MYYPDHHPPHFNAIYAEHEAQIVIETLEPLGESCQLGRSSSCMSGLVCTSLRSPLVAP